MLAPSSCPWCPVLPLLGRPGANALILWRYPASQGAWLNLASALFGVGCFLAPVLAELAVRGTAKAQHSHPHLPGRDGSELDTDGVDGGGGGGGGVAAGGPFSVRGGPAAFAYYLVSAGTCARMRVVARARVN